MDQRFAPIYTELALEFDPGYRARGRRAREEYSDADRVAFEALTEALAHSKTALRADARLFLLANMSLMVARPLLHPSAPDADREPNKSEIRDMLVKDAGIVIENARRDKDGTVTAAAILRSMAENLRKLDVKNWRIWDPDD